MTALLCFLNFNKQNYFYWYNYNEIIINRACKRNNFVLVDLLLKNGASKEIKNLEGKSADEYTTDEKVASLFNSNYI